MGGYISTEHTVWCGDCVTWLQMSQPKMAGMIRAIKESGWKKIKGSWTCPDCVKKRVEGQSK